MSALISQPPRVRLNVRVAAATADQLGALASRERRTQADIVETALLSLFTPDATDRRDAAMIRRLDRQSRQIEALQTDLGIAHETVALFIRFFFSVTPALPDSQQDAARAKGSERFAAFVDTLAKRLVEGKTLLHDLHMDIRPAADAFWNGDEVDGFKSRSTDAAA